jgi:tRNA threonylcarbamoyl adenosine modification protein (Sua5/YciO/YrdC/YwlC family)
VSQFFQIHPDNPQHRLILQAVEIINHGGVIVYPTDSAYALGCRIGDKRALERICRIRKLADKHRFTLVCRDLSELSVYARVNNTAYRLLKKFTPGPYTYILTASSEVPRRLMHPKRRTIGLRVPDHQITRNLLEALGAPLMSTTLILPDDMFPMSDPWEMRHVLEHDVELIIDGGYCGIEATTVVRLTEDEPEVQRVGLGDPVPFGGVRDK